MGRSYTYHVIGETNEQNIVGAMSRLEMAQKTAIEAKHGRRIATWHAQTRTGLRILGTDVMYFPVAARNVRRATVITCPVCEGDGCHVCRFSGITQKGEDRRYMPWQIDRMRQEAQARREVQA